MLRHDIGGALQSLIGAVGLVDAGRLDPQTRGHFERIAAAATALGALVTVAFDDAAVQSAPSVIKVDVFLDQLRRRYADEARERGLAFDAVRGPRMPEGLRLDPTSLARIADNLVTNAIKFTEAGAVTVSIAASPDGAILLRVCDDGPGMSAEEQAQAFRFGYRREGSTKPGHGVGLHVVKSLTSRLGGTVGLANRPAGGLEVTVRFPSEVGVTSAAPTSDPPAPDLAGVRVLLAEDNPTNQMVASQMLRSLDATVILFSDGVEALERFDEQPFDIVVVDIEMPRLSGLDVIRHIRARGDARARVPIVALTAYAMREHRERIAEAGANGLISKPITSVAALGRALAAHVGGAVRAGAPAGTVPVADAGEPAIDTAIFEALCQAIGPDTTGELLEKVIVDLDGARQTLIAALEPLDREPIRSASHILISVAGAFGAVQLQASAQALNALAHGEATARTVEEARRCIGEISVAAEFARRQHAAR